MPPSQSDTLKIRNLPGFFPENTQKVWGRDGQGTNSQTIIFEGNDYWVRATHRHEWSEAWCYSSPEDKERFIKTQTWVELWSIPLPEPPEPPKSRFEQIAEEL